MAEREVEAKLRLTGLTVPAVLELLSPLALKFSAETQQRDEVFATSADVIVKALPGSVVARIRSEAGRPAVLTVKRRRRHELDRDEVEVTVSDASAARECLELLGLSLIVVVEKRRHTAKLDNDVTVLVDDVRELGIFVEIEVLSEESAVAEYLTRTISEVRKLLDGVVATPETRGYDHLLLRS